ncbi:MAG: hypothetical protein ACMUEL_06790 [Flavobacteriales bacterium Tduv]
MGRDGEGNKKNISKRSWNKRQPTYSGISLFEMMLLSHWYNFSDVGIEELIKEILAECAFFVFDWKIRSQIIRFCANFAMK